MQPLPTIVEAATLMRSGRLTSVQLVEHCLANIDRLDDRIHAWVQVDRIGALNNAVAADREFAAGLDRGPLHGIPIGVKDIIDVEGIPTRCGSPLTSDSPAQRDAAVVAKLRAAGAIILGKTVTCEWACFDPSPTRNPWNLERSPGGSSSGSAAAVAAGMCLAAIGTQTGGSIIRPASFCGVCGFKPTWGNIDTDGVQPLASPFDHVGVIARSVQDMAAIHSTFDTTASESCFRSAPRRLVRLRGWFDDEADPDVCRAINAATARLTDAGAEIIQLSIDDEEWEAAVEDHRNRMAMQIACVHGERFAAQPDNLGPKITAVIESGLKLLMNYRDHVDGGVTGPDDRMTFRLQEFLVEDDFLLLPAVSTVACELDSTGDSRFQAVWSWLGMPAVTMPCGLSREDLPIGLQLVGLCDSDHELLEAGAWCERALNFQEQPSILNSR